MVQWLTSGTPTRVIRVQLASDGDHTGRHSANHNLLPDMHLRVPVLHLTTCLTTSLFKISGRYLVTCKVM